MFSQINNCKLFYKEHFYEDLIKELSADKVCRPLIICLEKDINIVKLLNEAFKNFDLKITLFCENFVVTESQTCFRAREVYRKNNCDCLISIGSETTLNFTKALCAIINNPISISFLDCSKLLVTNKETKYYHIGTSFCQGREMIPNIEVFENDEIVYLKDNNILPSVVFYSRNFIQVRNRVSLIEDIFNIIANNLEIYINKKANKLSKIYIENSLNLISDNMKRFIDDYTNKDTLDNIFLSSYLMMQCYGIIKPNFTNLVSLNLYKTYKLSFKNTRYLTLKMVLLAAKRTNLNKLKFLYEILSKDETYYLSDEYYERILISLIKLIDNTTVLTSIDQANIKIDNLDNLVKDIYTSKEFTNYLSEIDTDILTDLIKNSL